MSGCLRKKVWKNKIFAFIISVKLWYFAGKNIYHLKEISKGCEKLDVCFSRGQSLITENFVEKKCEKKW